ncbi:hypothetical protein DERP_013222 [Dermatophagoides pteronyssinus]|uniref:Uncharacterized protein n=1 Tax=Dermatophagoides pteronyssinus TaxID=6956 RepID=A0ABQ8IRF3_DERPT|nr:hypothetical protein DERP_013222 [Dermatophagoides pteronyssinus]
MMPNQNKQSEANLGNNPRRQCQKEYFHFRSAKTDFIDDNVGSYRKNLHHIRLSILVIEPIFIFSQIADDAR